MRSIIILSLILFIAGCGGGGGGGNSNNPEPQPQPTESVSDWTDEELPKLTGEPEVDQATIDAWTRENSTGYPKSDIMARRVVSTESILDITWSVQEIVPPHIIQYEPMIVVVGEVQAIPSRAFGPEVGYFRLGFPGCATAYVDHAPAEGVRIRWIGIYGTQNCDWAGALYFWNQFYSREGIGLEEDGPIQVDPNADAPARMGLNRNIWMAAYPDYSRDIPYDIDDERSVLMPSGIDWKGPDMSQNPGYKMLWQLYFGVAN